MNDTLLRLLVVATAGLIAVLLARRPTRRLFGAGPAFTLWLLPVVMMLAPLVPHGLAPAPAWSLPSLVVTPHVMAAAHAAAPLHWKHGVLVLWLVGAIAGLLRLTLHYLRLRRVARRAPPEWTRWLADAAPDLDPKRVRVQAAGPAVLWALPRALILLPSNFPQRFDNPVARELVLRHELTHARRGDAWWTLAMEIASALLWFHPLMWLARPRFRLDQELACDAASLRALPGSTANYAHALLDSIAVYPAPALIPWLAEPQLKARIAMITRMQPNLVRRAAGFAAVVGLIAAGLFGGGVVIAAPPAPGTTTPTQADIVLPAVNQGAQASTPPSVDVTFKNRNPPKYPVEALHKGQQGTVILDITVDATGKVTRIAVQSKGTTAPAVLQTAAIQAAQNWKFNPGRKSGQPVGGTIRVPVRFSLEPVNPCKPDETYAATLNQCVKLQPVGRSS